MDGEFPVVFANMSRAEKGSKCPRPISRRWERAGDRADPDGSVVMIGIAGQPHERGREVFAKDDVAKPGNVSPLRETQLELNLHGSRGGVEISDEVNVLLDAQASTFERRAAFLCAGGGKRDAHQTLATRLKELVETMERPGGIEDSAKLDISPGKHDAQVPCSPLQVAAKGRDGEPETSKCHDRSREVLDRDHGMVEAGYAVPKGFQFLRSPATRPHSLVRS